MAVGRASGLTDLERRLYLLLNETWEQLWDRRSDVEDAILEASGDVDLVAKLGILIANARNDCNVVSSLVRLRDQLQAASV